MDVHGEKWDQCENYKKRAGAPSGRRRAEAPSEGAKGLIRHVARACITRLSRALRQLTKQKRLHGVGVGRVTPLPLARLWLNWRERQAQSTRLDERAAVICAGTVSHSQH